MSHTTERVVTPVAPSIPAGTGTEPQHPSRFSRRTALGWGAVASGLVAAVVLAALTFMSGSEPAPIEGTPPSSDSWPAGVPRSADGAERYLADQGIGRMAGLPAGLPGSADAAERYLANHSGGAPIGAPHSADGAEQYFANR